MATKKQESDDTEDMKRVLIYFKMLDAMNKLTLNKGVSMKDVKTKTGQLQGFNYVVTEMANEYPNCKKFLGESPEERALMQQWLQYAVLLRGRPNVPEHLLKEIDTSLAFTTFLAGHSLTFADPVLYLTLYSTFLDLSFYEKERYKNLSRWFRLMQNQDDLRKGNRKVIFSKIALYNSLSAHP